MKKIPLSEISPLLPKNNTKESTSLVETCLRVDSMCCNGEVKMVKQLLSDFDGIRNIAASVMDRLVFITHTEDVKPLMLVDKLNTKFLGASLRESGDTVDNSSESNTCDHLPLFAQFILFSTAITIQRFSTFCPFPCDISSLRSLDYVFLMSHDNATSYDTSGAILATIALGFYLIVLILSYKVYQRALSALLLYQINADVLMVTAIFGSVAQGELMSAAMVALIVTTMDDIKMAVFATVSKRLKTMYVLFSFNFEIIFRTKFFLYLTKEFCFCHIFPKSIPCDGLVVKGSAQVDESRVTGEPLLVAKNKKLQSRVQSGSVVQFGFLVVEAEAVVKDSFRSKINDLVATIQSTKSHTQSLVDMFASWYTPIIIIIAIFVSLYQHNFTQFLVIIVAGCPCAIVGAAPMVWATSVAILAKRYKLLVKSSEALSNLASITSVGVDKTGTITNGEFKVIDMKVFTPPSDKNLNCGWTFEDVHRWAATVESADNHPLARSIMSSYTGCVVSFAGAGELPQLTQFKRHDRCGAFECFGCSFSFQFLVTFCLVRNYVPNANGVFFKYFFTILISCALLTGDKGAAVDSVASVIDFELGVYQGQLPEEKGREVVAFIGDGLNDCIALANADIGIAVQEIGSRTTADAASAVLQGDLGNLPGAIIVAKRAQQLVIFNICLAISINAIVILLVVFRGMALWLSVIADSVSLFVVLANSFWPLLWSLSRISGGDRDTTKLVKRFTPMSDELID
eukprot:GSMAST32.ASY1.ANO1.1004.1 assembled CDS